MIMLLCTVPKKSTISQVGIIFLYICIMHLHGKILRGFEKPGRGNRILNLVLSLLLVFFFSSLRGNNFFTNSPSLGITATHPIYSTTYHDWRLAGELEVGERVLTYQGEATVSSTEKRAGSETVYNLEVKDLHNFLVGDEGVVVHNSYIIKECFNSAVDYLKSNAKYFLNGTGKYKTVGGHHPLAKKAFELDSKYNLDEAFSISPNSLKEAWKLGNPGVPPANIHNLITGKQNSLYSSWRASNPAPAKMTFRDMIEIERQAMMQSGIPEDVANGWIIKGVEDLKKLGVKEITNIPWNGTN